MVEVVAAQWLERLFADEFHGFREKSSRFIFSFYYHCCTKVEAMFQKCVNAKKDKVFFGGTMLNAKWVKEHASLSSADYAGMLASYPCGCCSRMGRNR